MVGKVPLIALVLVCIPLSALIGGILTRNGKPLGRLVERHYRVVVTSVWLGVVVAGYINSRNSTALSDVVVLIAWCLCAGMFMPSLRYLQNRTGRSHERRS
jgi:hypothetical protein